MLSCFSAQPVTWPTQLPHTHMQLPFMGTVASEDFFSGTAAGLAGDPRVDLISGLGLTLDPAVAAVPLSAGTFASTVGLEQADLLNDVDVLFTWFNDTDNQASIEAQPLFAQIPAFARGSYVPNVDNQLAMASSLLTPLSVPWALDAYIPMIKDAAANVSK